jgi:hypothetical protein
MTPKDRPGWAWLRYQGGFTADDALLVCGGLLSIFLLAQLVAFEYGRDQGIYAVVAERLLHGQPPYRGTWDFKPPGIFFVFALAQLLFGSSMHAVRLCEAAGYASVIYASGVLSRRYLGTARPGILGGLLAVLAHVELEFWHTAQPESFAAVTVVWAMVCATYVPAATDAHRTAKQVAAWCGAGALYAIAALLKPPCGGGILVSFGIIVWQRWRAQAVPHGWAALRAPALAFAAGAAAPLVVTASYFASSGAMSELYDALVVFAPRYTALSWDANGFTLLLLQAITSWATGFSVFNIAGLVFLALLPAQGQREREGALHMVGVIAILLVGVALQAKFFAYHFDAALCLTALLAGWGFWKLWIAARLRPVGVVAFAAFNVLLLTANVNLFGLPDPFWARCRMRITALLEPSVRGEINDRLYSVGEVDAGANRRVGHWIESHTPTDAKIYVWGFEPVIYLLARRQPASRYIYNVPQRVAWAADTSRRELLDELQRAQPAAIVVEQRDFLPLVTGNPYTSATALPGFPALQALLRNDYTHAVSIGELDVYVRNDVAVGQQAAPRESQG